MSRKITKKLASVLFKPTVRPLILVGCLVLTVFFGFAIVKHLKVNTDLVKMIPTDHPYVQNFLKHKDDMSLGNDIRIVVEDTKDPDIFNQQYMQVLKQVTDDVFNLQGVDPSTITSLWTPGVRWHAVTVEGFQAGAVVPDGYDSSMASQQQLRINVLRSGQVGRLVADNFQSNIVKASLLSPFEGKQAVDIPTLNHALNQLREHYQQKYPFIQIHIVGFAKQAGDIMAAGQEVADFFFLTMLVTLLLLLWDTRCLRSSLVVVIGSFVSVIWQLGIVSLLGFTIDPYSMLVPFLVFAISVSHGVQIINSMVSYSADGKSPLEASRAAFTSLFLPGITALLCDAIGFATLYVIHIEAIRELALAAGIGVAVIIITKLTLVPVLMSYLGVSKKACRKSLARRNGKRPVAHLLARFTRARWAMVSVLIAVLGYGVGIWYSQNLQIGDTGSGAPSLWTGPCVTANNCERGHVPKKKYAYNYDLHYLASHYGVSADVLVVMGVTPDEACNTYGALEKIDRLDWMLRGVTGVQNVQSLATAIKLVNEGMNEGSPKWRTLSSDQYVLNSAMRNMPDSLYNQSCSLDRIYVFLDDHKAATLRRVTDAVSQFAKANNDPKVIQFELAAGNAGIEAATNQSIDKSHYTMLWLVYAVVIILCLLAFRSWRAMLCIVIPLGLTSILCEALMVWLDMGVKVATLPVIALGVGIGVDYGIYIFDKLRTYLDEGMGLEDAYYETMRTTGKAVTFTGLTLAVGVIFWMFSSIKFQADMGLLLTFMFLWNMVGALWLLPALARFLLKDVEAGRPKAQSGTP
jgi:predicted RND superfamily exporter protein